VDSVDVANRVTRIRKSSTFKINLSHDADNLLHLNPRFHDDSCWGDERWEIYNPLLRGSDVNVSRLLCLCKQFISL
uniref:Uncharacterized protein n=1 Tax=Echeneis naucrates TaxID=173247 RepID=A0A665W8W8_ECHNA